jgi:hypothetical protein
MEMGTLPLVVPEFVGGVVVSLNRDGVHVCLKLRFFYERRTCPVMDRRRNSSRVF